MFLARLLGTHISSVYLLFFCRVSFLLPNLSWSTMKVSFLSAASLLTTNPGVSESECYTSPETLEPLTRQIEIKPPSLLYKSDLFGFSSDGVLFFTCFWDNDPIGQQQPGTQDYYCLLLFFSLLFFSFFFCSLSLAAITIQYMHCFIKSCTEQFRYKILQISFFFYLLNVPINRRCKKISAWWWILPLHNVFL